MNDFWEWMKEKDYGERECFGGTETTFIYHHQEHSNHITSIKPTEQMLIGYMMEYLREVSGRIILNTTGRATIEDVYKRLSRELRGWEGKIDE